MSNMLGCLVAAVLIGVGGTAVMDVWGALQKRLGTPGLDYALLGRWLAYLPRGRFFHQPIATTPPVRGERVIGWTSHYLIGIAFAAVLIGVWGISWIERPTIAPALIIGISGVVAPFFVMQPAMGAGIAASRTTRPWIARGRSLATHTVFGFGLYMAGTVVSWLV